ncbi:hypothetical protein R3P38DRAFT_3580395 [Favolaschia claudopus]|uniref:Uncharacterized protein n=1 Tax=Favolaschia claudopus TaxID=2862362 RepID=A0AAW0AJ81_9AGAR
MKERVVVSKSQTTLKVNDKVKDGRSPNKAEARVEVRESNGREVGSGWSTHNQNQCCELTFIPRPPGLQRDSSDQIFRTSVGIDGGGLTNPTQPAIQSEKRTEDRQGGGNDPGMAEVGGKQDNTGQVKTQKRFKSELSAEGRETSEGVKTHLNPYHNPPRSNSPKTFPQRHRISPKQIPIKSDVMEEDYTPRYVGFVAGVCRDPYCNAVENEHECWKQEHTGLRRRQAAGGLRSPVPTTRVAGASFFRPKPGVFKVLLIAWKAVRALLKFSPKFCRLDAWQPSIFILCAILTGWGARLIGAVHPASSFKSRLCCQLYWQWHENGMNSRRATRHALFATGFGRRQANPALQLIHTSTSPSRARLVTARAPRSFNCIDFLPASSKAKAALHTQTNEVPPYRTSSSARFGSAAQRRCIALTIQKFFPRAALRVLRWGFCRRQAKTASPNSRQRLYPEPHELFAARIPLSIQIFVPASEISGTLPPAGKSRSSNSKQRHHELRCSLRRREAALRLRVYRNDSGERLPRYRTWNINQVKFPTFSEIRVFIVRRANLPRADLVYNSTQNSKIDFPASAERRLCAGSCSGSQTSHQIKQLISVSAQVNSNFKISTLTQNSGLGGISRFKQYILKPHPKGSGKTASCKPKNPIFLPGTIRKQTATYLREVRARPKSYKSGACESLATLVARRA